MKIADYITWTGIIAQTSSNSGKIRLVTFELHLLVLECQKTNNRFCPEHSLCNYLIFIELANKYIEQCPGIKYSTSWKLCHIALFTLELNALDYLHVGSQMSDGSHWATCYLWHSLEIIVLGLCFKLQDR